MGWICEVKFWKNISGTSSYHYETFYEGESFEKAIEAMKELRDRGKKCICFEWRP